VKKEKKMMKNGGDKIKSNTWKPTGYIEKVFELPLKPPPIIPFSPIGWRRVLILFFFLSLEESFFIHLP
jgi:hypothetical protein